MEGFDPGGALVGSVTAADVRGGPDGNGPGRDWVTDCAAQATPHEQLTAAQAALTP